MVRPLIRYCEAFLLENLSAGNVFTVLQYTIDCETDKKLKDKCAEIICAKTKDVLKSDEFLKISSKCLEFLLDQDSLSAPEVELFNSVCPLDFLITKKKWKKNFYPNIPNLKILNLIKHPFFPFKYFSF